MIDDPGPCPYGPPALERAGIDVPPTGPRGRRPPPDSAMRPRASKLFLYGRSWPRLRSLRLVRQPVGKAIRHSRRPDAARRAVGGRRRRGAARGAPRAAGGRRRARRGARLHRAGEEARGRRRRHQVGHARPDGRQDRPRRAGRDARLRRAADRPQRRGAGADHDGRPAGLRQNHHHRQDRQAPHRARQPQGADGLARHPPSGRDGAARRARPAGRRATLPIVEGQTPVQIASRAIQAGRARRLRRGAARHRRPHHARRSDDERGRRGQARRRPARSAAGRRQR